MSRLAALPMTPDLITALRPVLDVLERLNVRHFVGGSLASSAHGIPRASIDADVVAELKPEHVGQLIATLQESFYVPEERVIQAVARCTSFNVIHLGTMVKVDVFVSRGRPIDLRALARVEAAPLEEGGTIPVSSPEDTLLAKLEWFRQGGETSERQWSDVKGLLRAGRPLDTAYLEAGASEIGVSDLLHRLLAERRDRSSD